MAQEVRQGVRVGTGGEQRDEAKARILGLTFQGEADLEVGPATAGTETDQEYLSFIDARAYDLGPFLSGAMSS